MQPCVASLFGEELFPMPQSDAMELAAKVVAAFVSSNPLPKGELPALIQTIYDTLARLSGETENPAPNEEPKEPAVSIRKSITPEYLICLRGRQTIQVAEKALGGAWPDAGSISREMEASLQLSYGRAQQRRRTVGIGESDRSWTVGWKARSTQARTPAEGQARPVRIAERTKAATFHANSNLPFSDPSVAKEVRRLLNFAG